MRIKIIAIQIINFEISHNFLRLKMIINYFESRHNLLHCTWRDKEANYE
jgi:hypothetical protein